MLKLSPKELMEIPAMYETVLLEIESEYPIHYVYDAITVYDAPSIGEGFNLIAEWFAKIQQPVYLWMKEETYLRLNRPQIHFIKIVCLPSPDGINPKLSFDISIMSQVTEGIKLIEDPICPIAIIDSDIKIKLQIKDFKVLDRLLGTMNSKQFDECIIICNNLLSDELHAYLRLIGFGRYWLKYNVHNKSFTNLEEEKEDHFIHS